MIFLKRLASALATLAILAPLILCGTTNAQAQSADSTSFAPSTLSTSSTWDPGSSAAALSANLLSIYNNSNSELSQANSGASTANYAQSVASGAVNTAGAAQSKTSTSGSGVSNITLDRAVCGVDVYYANGSVVPISLVACDNGPGGG